MLARGFVAKNASTGQCPLSHPVSVWDPWDADLGDQPVPAWRTLACCAPALQGKGGDQALPAPMQPPCDLLSCCSKLQVQVPNGVFNFTRFGDTHWNTWTSFPLSLDSGTLLLRLVKVTSLGWGYWIIRDSKFSYFRSCARTLGDLACPDDYDGCWRRNSVNHTFDEHANLSMRCLVDTKPAVSCQNTIGDNRDTSLDNVQWWGWTLSGCTFLLLCVVFRSWCALLYLVFFSPLTYLSAILWPEDCNAYLMYPAMVWTTITPSHELDLIGVRLLGWRGRAVLTSTYRLLVGTIYAAYILPGPCDISKVHGEVIKIENIPVAMRKDVILAGQSIYPYVCILGAVLVWAPECIAHFSSRTTLQHMLRRPLPSTQSSASTSSTPPTSGGSNSHPTIPWQKVVMHKVVEVAGIVLVCILLGVWDVVALVDLVAQSRSYVARLRVLAWTDAPLDGTTVIYTLSDNDDPGTAGTTTPSLAKHQSDEILTSAVELKGLLSSAPAPDIV